MIDTSLRVGAFLEAINDDMGARYLLGNRITSSNRVGIWGAKSRQFDFTPGAQGAWKAFEREINLSVVQAARHARTVKMPDFFALYDASIRNPRLCKVDTGRGSPVDINQRDWEDSRGRRQRFLALGDAWHVVRVMHGSPDEVFDSVITRCLGSPLPQALLDDWRQIYNIRNSASHTRPLSKSEYETALEKTLAPGNLYPLIRIKRALSR